MSQRKSKMNRSSHASNASKYTNAHNSDKFGMDPNFYSDQAEAAGDTFQNLCNSDYSKVIFCDLYYNNDSTVGCRFQITDHVHEDPCDYIGLFRVGFINLSQCLAAKMLSKCDCEEDGKLIRCTFKPSELPVLENGFYQFLYVTRDSEICGASMPFQINNTISKELDDDIVADCSEDDFLVVRSNMKEKNRRLQALLDEMTEKCLSHECAMKRVQQELKIVSEEKIKLEHSLKQACAEKVNLINESQRIAEEKDIVCSEKEEAIRILKEKNKVFSSMFDNYSDKLREFTDLKDALEADKNLAIAENVKLQDRIEQLNKDIQNERKLLDLEKEKNRNLIINMKKDTIALTSQLDDSRLMIEVLEKSKKLSMDELALLTEEITKLKGKLKDVKCENLILKSRLSESQLALEKVKIEKQNLLSETAALKIHILENLGSKPSRRRPSKSDDREKIQVPASLEVAESDAKQASSSDAKQASSSDAKQASSSDTKQASSSDAKQASSSDIKQASSSDTKQASSSDIKQASSSDAKQASLSSEVKKKEKSLSKLQEENIQTDETKEDIEKMRIHCNELHAEIEKKNQTIVKLQEELLKTRGVVEYLSKERDSAQKNESQKQQALDECILRLNEAAELYKKQFRKIEKLKKKLSKNCSDLMERSSTASMSVKDICSAAESADEALSGTSKLPEANNSDSDTGEHVLRHPTAENFVTSTRAVLVTKQVKACSYPTDDDDVEPSCSKNREIPELQTMIEMNLEKFSKSKDEVDMLYALPCPICNQDIGIFMTSTDEMLKHLEMQHKQQICPVCGRLFDMTLPPKYFMFHVEDHFNKEEKK